MRPGALSYEAKAHMNQRDNVQLSFKRQERYIYTKHITDVILTETNPTMSRAEDLCPLAWLCANCMQACLPFPPLGCPVPTTGRHYKAEVCMKDVRSTFVEIIESCDMYLFSFHSVEEEMMCL